MASINNKIVWITGASSGIGEALARLLADKNTKLILSSRKKEVLEKVKASLSENAQENTKILPLDLSQPSTLNEKAKEALDGVYDTI